MNTHHTHIQKKSISILDFYPNLFFTRRAIMVRRAVRVNSQLKSHKRFATAFPKYCKLVDNARLYCTNAVRGPPKVRKFFESIN